MRIDFSPLYRSAIGFDRLASLLDAADSQPSYPPYNVELVGEDNYRITMAVAGFVEDELDIISEQNVLKIVGRKRHADESQSYLYQGIAARNFERKFQLAEHVKVLGAQLEHGLLHVNLEREIPEAMKPRKISINGQAGSQRLEQNADKKETRIA